MSAEERNHAEVPQGFNAEYYLNHVCELVQFGEYYNRKPTDYIGTIGRRAQAEAERLFETTEQTFVPDASLSTRYSEKIRPLMKTQSPIITDAHALKVGFGIAAEELAEITARESTQGDGTPSLMPLPELSEKAGFEFPALEESEQQTVLMSLLFRYMKLAAVITERAPQGSRSTLNRLGVTKLVWLTSPGELTRIYDRCPGVSTSLITDRLHRRARS